MYVVRINKEMDGKFAKPLVPRLVGAQVVQDRKACTPKICKSTEPQLATERLLRILRFAVKMS